MNLSRSRTVVLSDGCHKSEPMDVTVFVHGEDPALASLAFERPWTRLSFGMSRDDLERVSRAIVEVLETPADDAEGSSPVTREDFLRGIGESDHPDPF
jgi:ribosome maturation factor RimP